MTEKVTEPMIIAPCWSGVVIPRTARKHWRCIAADEYRPGFWVKTTHPESTVGWVKTFRFSIVDAERYEAAQREKYPTADVAIERDLNPEYREGDCLGDIHPGDRYGEYVGETAAYQSGSRYCARCTTAVWGDVPSKQEED